MRFACSDLGPIQNAQAFQPIGGTRFYQERQLFSFGGDVATTILPIFRWGTPCAAQNSYVNRLPAGRSSRAFNEPGV